MKKMVFILVGIITTSSIMRTSEPEQAETINEYLKHNKDESLQTVVLGVAELLKNGADINAKVARGNTPLINSILLGLTPISKYLIDRSADIRIRNKEGKTALMLAREKENNMKEVVSMIEARLVTPRKRGRTQDEISQFAIALPA